MTRDPVKDLEDQIRLFRTELSEMKLQQLTKSEFKAFQSSLEALAQQILEIQEAAAQGAFQGAGKLLSALNSSQGAIGQKVDKAVGSLSEAKGALSEGVLARRRNVGLLMALSALTALVLGFFLYLPIYDHILKRDFGNSVQFMGWEWSCTRQGGFIADQQHGKYCAFEIWK